MHRQVLSTSAVRSPMDTTLHTVHVSMAQPLRAMILAMLVLLVCSACSHAIRPSDVAIAGTSQQAKCMYVYFNVPAGVHCPGVRIRSDGQRRLITFLESKKDASTRVDSVATLPNDHAWEGNLRVEVPIDATILERGGTLELVIEGPGESISLGTWTYPNPGPRMLGK